MVTKEDGLPALDARRERMGWTRTLVRVNVETGAEGGKGA